ncbi:hypothetical protein Lalb_Chr10g0097051 [Lupinus albus]|uniref:Uncharacterized protein n=1 Tax=Lupinus albus TaxID=3870 RepID=A0A6A4PUP0_LUPAL|nr:hypothetical protein Lalb_Chr10g0097051 [Lupinus albus]
MCPSLLVDYEFMMRFQLYEGFGLGFRVQALPLLYLLKVWIWVVLKS